MKRSQRIVSLIAVGSVFLFVASLHANAATIIYSNFGPGFGSDSITNGHGSCVSGNATPNCGPLTYRWIAAPFTPAGNFDLSQIDLALGFLSGTNGAIINLVNSSGGLPGTSILESWTVTNVPPTGPFTLTPVLTLLSPGGVKLNNGTGYWLVAEGLANDTLDFWWSSPFASTPHVEGSLNQGASWILSDVSSGAFDVLGTATATPEPSSTALIVTAILGLELLRRRSKKDQRKSIPHFQ